MHHRQPRLRGLLLRRLLLRALHRHASGLYQDLHGPSEAPKAGQHQAQQPGFQGQLEGPTQGPEIPLPSDVLT